MPNPSPDELQITRRHLPHWQLGGKTYFVTFRTASTQLSTIEREAVLARIQAGRGRYFTHHVSVVMPDHVHMLLTPTQESAGNYFDLQRILRGIKGSSARDINRLRGSSGSVWQEESYDRIMRDHQEFTDTFDYICLNPVRKGLAQVPREYPFILLPVEWHEGPIQELAKFR
jgi:putative transposase